jgi:hypothetical protein
VFSFNINPGGTFLFANNDTITYQLCVSPKFINQPTVFLPEVLLDNFNFNLATGSPAIGTGVVVSGVTNDYSGTIRPSPPSIGAYEFITVIKTVSSGLFGGMRFSGFTW